MCKQAAGLLFVCLLVISLIPVTISAATQEESITTAYKSENSRTRKQALRDAAGCKATWAQNLLATALNDKSPIVVEVAVQEIGKLNLSNLSGDLMALYVDARTKYKGYGERVRCSIIPALGKLGTVEAKTFLVDLLKNDNGSQMGEYLLLGIKSLKDKSLIGEIRAYSTKMNSLIAQKKTLNLDPISWSRNLAYINIASSIETYLALEGGINE